MAQATFAATVVDEWIRAGVTDAVMAPGSRSTPIALALADAADAGRLRLHVHLDERAAAFYAVGLGLASGRPAVVLTTSGTATAELLPAMVEAHHARVPVIACTADRPPELHHVGAAQTIEQDALYGGVLRWRVDPGPVDAVPVEAWRSLASRMVAEARCGPAGPGPVHCNLAFRDPLTATPGPLPEGRPGGRPWHDVQPVPLNGVGSGGPLLGGRCGVIVAGAGCGDPAAVLGLARALEWPLLADPRSGCRGRSEPSVVAGFDAILRAPAWAEAHRPEVVLRLGSPPASKVLAGWLAATAVEQVVVDPWGAWPDPDRTAAVVWPADPAGVCRALTGGMAGPAPEGWLARWARAESQAQAAIDRVLAGHPEPTEPGVARAVTAALGADRTLVVASSMPIRDVEWFGHPGSAARVLANRGANGIDGTVSTALGVAAATAGPVTALVGDLAFLHDAGALLWSARRGLDLTMVVVDNDGGGIFSFLPQAGELGPARFEQLFGTPHGVDLAALAAVHGVGCQPVTAMTDVEAAVRDGERAGGVRLVLARTDRAANVAVHDELNRAVVAALGG